MPERRRRQFGRAKGRCKQEKCRFNVALSRGGKGGNNAESRRRKVDVQKLGHYRGGRDFDKDDVVEADAVERVEQRKTALYLVRFDHALEDVFDGDMLALARKVVSDGKNGSEIVGRVAPLEQRHSVRLRRCQK